jgi:hypothetical protein
MEKYNKPSQEIPWLNELFSSLRGATGMAGTRRTGEATPEETTSRLGIETSRALVFGTIVRDTVINSATGQPETGGSLPRRNTGKGGGSVGGGSGEGTGGGRDGSSKVPKRKVKARAFRTGEQRKVNDRVYSVYRVFLDSDTPVEPASIAISQHGDAGRAGAFEIGNVKTLSGEQLEFASVQDNKGKPAGFKIAAVPVPGAIEICVNEPYKSSFTFEEI